MFKKKPIIFLLGIFSAKTVCPVSDYESRYLHKIRINLIETVHKQTTYVNFKL